MGAWITKPECGVPVHQLVQVPSAAATVNDCARLNGVWGFGALLVVSLVLVVLCCTLKAPSSRGKDPKDHTDHEDHKDRGDGAKPLIPWWAPLIPLGVGVAWLGTAQTLARAKLAVANADFATSAMDKPTWLEYKAANTRTHGQVLAALGGSGLASAAILGAASVAGH